MATTTENLGLTKPEYTEKADIAVINSNMDKIDEAVSSNTEKIAAANSSLAYTNNIMQQRDRVWNLLDNSDFRNPVNQRGQSTYATNNAYTIDRWLVEGGTCWVIENDFLSTNGQLVQRIPAHKMSESKTYTLAVMDRSGSIHVGSAAGTILFDNGTYGFHTVKLNAGELCWAALYEGEYTADTLPVYMPKGYAAELLECQRYFLPGVGGRVCGSITNEGTFVALIPTPVQMRALPDVQNFFGDNIITNVGGVGSITTLTGASAEALQSNGVRMIFTTDLTPGDKSLATAMSFATNCNLSADL